MTITLAAVAALLAIAAIVLTLMVQSDAPRPGTNQQVASPPTKVEPEPGELRHLLDVPNAVGPKGTPADLPLPDGAVRLMARRDALPGPAGERLVEQIGVWRVPGGDLPDLAEFYEQAAAQAGFHPLKSSRQYRPSIWNQAFAREGDLLIIRLRDTGATLRLTLIFRYTERPGF